MGIITCSHCKRDALEYDDNVLPYCSGKEAISSIHFKVLNPVALPLSSNDPIKCPWCRANGLVYDIGSEWKRVSTNKEWDR